jgi:hypothetical protein
MTANNKKTSRRLRRGMVTIVALALALTTTTLALATQIYETGSNRFTTGDVRIGLYDLYGKNLGLSGDALIQTNNFEPGATFCRSFEIKNETSNEFYYKFYFTFPNGIDGSLANVLQVSITDRVADGIPYSNLRNDQIIYPWTLMSKLTRDQTDAIEAALAGYGSRDFTIWFHFPEEATNETQNLKVSFNFTAEAVQVRNNTNRQFD